MSTPTISVIAPVSRAVERVKDVLFRPFSASKWFTIGFCAWLAYLGHGGGGGGGFHYGAPHRGDGGVEHARVELWRARDYLMDHLYWIVPLAVVLILFGLALWVLFTWLNSRGMFMFLHCVARNRAEVAEPWQQYGREGNSLFAFRLGLGLVSMAVLLPLLLWSVLRFLEMFMDARWDARGVRDVILLGAAWLVGVIAFGIVRRLTNDFVVPLMFLRRKRWHEGWSECGRLLAAHPGNFVLYLLFQIVLAVAIGVIVVAVVLATCCIAGCFLALPYLGTVLLLPVLVFVRSYSLYYLAQYGPEFDAFRSAEPVPIVPGTAPSPPVM
jgi:hypothetical protein